MRVDGRGGTEGAGPLRGGAGGGREGGEGDGEFGVVAFVVVGERDIDAEVVIEALGG